MAIPNRPFTVDVPREPEHRTRHRAAIIAKWIGGVILFPILLGLVIAAVLINTSFGKNKILGILQDQASQSLNTGAPAELRASSFHAQRRSLRAHDLWRRPASHPAAARGTARASRRSHRLSFWRE